VLKEFQPIKFPSNSHFELSQSNFSRTIKTLKGVQSHFLKKKKYVRIYRADFKLRLNQDLLWCQDLVNPCQSKHCKTWSDNLHHQVKTTEALLYFVWFLRAKGLKHFSDLCKMSISKFEICYSHHWSFFAVTYKLYTTPDSRSDN